MHVDKKTLRTSYGYKKKWVEATPILENKKIALCKNLKEVQKFSIVCKPKVVPTNHKKSRCMLGPLGEFSGVFGYLIENQYKLEHLKFASV
jgi:hypothetical protein